MKIFSKEKMSDEDKIALETEIEILMQIDHPNIVKLFEVFNEDDHWCLVMELMEGGDLFSQIEENKKFSEKEVRDATKLLVDAINYFHSLEILHRDIKLENLALVFGLLIVNVFTGLIYSKDKENDKSWWVKEAIIIGFLCALSFLTER